MKDTIVIPVGPEGGVGQVLGFAMPSFVVKKGKAENFLMELVEPSVSGETDFSTCIQMDTKESECYVDGYHWFSLTSSWNWLTWTCVPVPVCYQLIWC